MADSRRIERKTVSYRSQGGTLVEVSIYVNADHLMLTKGEVAGIATHLADAAMLSINGTPHVRAPLSKIKVK